LARGYTGTVHFTSNDPNAILPADTTLTNGGGTFLATLSPGRRLIIATDTANASITGSSVGIPVFAPSHDFNFDHRSDALWYNTATGQVVTWLLNGTTLAGGGSPGSASSPFAIVGQRDFNGDGKADILWRNSTTGQLVVWLLNGPSVIGGGSPGSAASP